MEYQKTYNPVGWFEIYVDEMPRAKKFYEGVFKTKLEGLANPGTEDQGLEMWSFPGNMTAYGAPGALVSMSGYPAGKNSVIIYFSCEDCKIEETRVREFGGRVEKPKMAIGEYGFISICIDSEGNVIGLHSMK